MANGLYDPELLAEIRTLNPSNPVVLITRIVTLRALCFKDKCTIKRQTEPEKFSKNSKGGVKGFNR